MGGAETLRAAPSHLDKFAWIGVFSTRLQEGADAGVNSEFVEHNADFFADPEKTNQRVKLFWVAAGKDDPVVGDGPKRLCPILRNPTTLGMSIMKATAATPGSTGASM